MEDCENAVVQVEKCGAWTLGREIGRGASGIVYLATNEEGKTAAVKVCRRKEQDSDRYERELRGAKLYRRIPAGEGLVRLLELGECDWGFYTVTELADAEFGTRSGGMEEYQPNTLSRVIAGERALSVKESLKLGLALAKGLVVLQRHHLLHRDIKPGNVIYVRGCPVLTDPGLLVDEAEAASLVGTPGYVPPENFVGAGGDVYSLGLTLKAASFGRSVEELEKGPTLEADTGNPLFATWWRILNKATHPDVLRRYRSAKALLKDLQLLRLRLLLSVKMFGLPRLVWILILLLAVVLGAGVCKIKSSADESAARWKAQDEYVAREAKKAREQVNALSDKIKGNADKMKARAEKMRLDMESLKAKSPRPKKEKK